MMRLLLTDQRPRRIYPLLGRTRKGEEGVLLLLLIDSERIIRYMHRLRQSFPEYEEADLIALLYTVGQHIIGRGLRWWSEEVTRDPLLLQAAAWYVRVHELGLSGRVIVGGDYMEYRRAGWT